MLNIGEMTANVFTRRGGGGDVTENFSFSLLKKLDILKVVCMKPTYCDGHLCVH